MTTNAKGGANCELRRHYRLDLRRRRVLRRLQAERRRRRSRPRVRRQRRRMQRLDLRRLQFVPCGWIMACPRRRRWPIRPVGSVPIVQQPTAPRTADIPPASDDARRLPLPELSPWAHALDLKGERWRPSAPALEPSPIARYRPRYDQQVRSRSPLAPLPNQAPQGRWLSALLNPPQGTDREPPRLLACVRVYTLGRCRRRGASGGLPPGYYAPHRAHSPSPGRRPAASRRHRQSGIPPESRACSP